MNGLESYIRDLKRVASTNGGEQWTPIERTETSKLLGSGVTSITFDPVDPVTMYVGTGMSGHLLQSADGGESWQLTGWNPPDQPRDERYGSVRDLYVVPETNTMYVAASPGFTPHGAYRSRDGGATWEPFTEGLPDSVTAVQLTGVPQREELYIVVTEGDTGGVYKYKLEAKSNGWTRIGIDGLRQSYYYASDLFYSSAGNALYVGLDGVFRMKLE